MPEIPRIASTLASVLALTGCAHSSADKKAAPTAVERLGVNGALAGEWVRPGRGDDFLLFKPDPAVPRSGRVLGLGEFDRYRITNRTPGSTFPMEITSSESDTDVPSFAATVQVSANGQELTFTVAGSSPIPGERRRSYRKVRM